MDVLFALAIGFALALALAVLWTRRGGKSGGARETHAHASLTQLRAIGELSVFKALTKEIVTEVDHTWGEFGKNYLSWMLSNKKMAMIFEFEMDFRYDLRSPEFAIEEEAGGHVLRMPPCRYETHIRDIQFYDEQRSKLIPWLLPDLLNSLFTQGFSEQDRNRLKDAARKSAQAQAQALVVSLGSEVEQSARQTLESLARAFGVENVSFVFRKPDLNRVQVTYELAEAKPEPKPGAQAIPAER